MCYMVVLHVFYKVFSRGLQGDNTEMLCDSQGVFVVKDPAEKTWGFLGMFWDYPPVRGTLLGTLQFKLFPLKGEAGHFWTFSRSFSFFSPFLSLSSSF